MPTRPQYRCRRCRRLRPAGPPRCPHCGPRPIDTANWAKLSRKLIRQHTATHGQQCLGLTWTEDPYGGHPSHAPHETTDLVVHHLNQDQTDWRPENLTVICRTLNSSIG